MPRSSDRFGRPVDVWPGFPDGDPPASAPVGLLELAHLARALRRHLDRAGVTVVALAETSGVDRTTIHDLLAGRAYIDVVTLARLEHATGTDLWPRHPR